MVYIKVGESKAPLFYDLQRFTKICSCWFTDGENNKVIKPQDCPIGKRMLNYQNVN